MRLLHTSDWHLGRSFHGFSLLEEQAAALARMVEIAREEEVDAVLIAGDIYDRAIPPAEAVRLFTDTLAQLRDTGAAVVAIAGNHDSHVRVSVYDPLLSAFGVTIRGDVRRAHEPVIVSPRRGGPPVAIYPLPYLDPVVDGALHGGSAARDSGLRGVASGESGRLSGGGADLDVGGKAGRGGDNGGDDSDGDGTGDSPADGTGDGAAQGSLFEAATPALGPEPAAAAPTTGRLRHEEVTRLALGRIRGDWRGRPGHRSVVVAHTFVAGGEGCDSERELTVGNVDRVSVEAFAGFDLVALGHLHRPQELDGPRLAYSGSPLPYSFSEEGQRKGVRLVELDPTGRPAVVSIPLALGRPLATIEGSIEQLLRDPAFEGATSAWVRVFLTDEALPLQAKARLQRRFPHIAELRHRPPHSERASMSERHQRVRQASSPIALLRAFFDDQQGRPATPAEQHLLRQALDAASRHGRGLQASAEADSEGGMEAGTP